MQTHHTSSEGQYEINEKRAEDRNTRGEGGGWISKMIWSFRNRSSKPETRKSEGDFEKKRFLEGGKEIIFIWIFIWVTDELEFISENWQRLSIFSLFKAKLSRSTLRFKLWRLKEGPCKNLDYEHWTIFIHGCALFGNLEIFWLYIFILFQIFKNILKCIYSSLSI